MSVKIDHGYEETLNMKSSVVLFISKENSEACGKIINEQNGLKW